MRELPGLVSEEYAVRPLSRFRAKEWALVLMARGVPHRMRRKAGGWTLFAPRRRAEEAAGEILAYLRENREELPPPSVPRRPSNLGGTLAALVGVGLLFALLRSDVMVLGRVVRWSDIGGGDSAAILAGQWWRVATALTLHADAAHLLGNLAVGGVFLVLLCRETGVGLGFFLCLAAGLCGNLLKVDVQGAGHLFIGASTAVFGALGVLGGYRTAHDFKALSWKKALPAGAGLGLLAMLGAGGEEPERIDLAGHFLGFAAGLAIGAAAGAALRGRNRPGRLTNVVFGCAAALLVAEAWREALAHMFG